MVEFLCNILDDGASWRLIAPLPGSPVPDVVKLSFSTAGFVKIPERDAFERIKAVLRHNNESWIEPTAEKWQIELDELSKRISETVVIPWLRGAIHTKPDFVQDILNAGNRPVYTATFTFYITLADPTPLMKLDVFISHSSKDTDVAEALIELIQAAIRISPDRIRCTSVDGYRLPGGVSTDEQLKREVRESNYFIGLLTPVSLKSSYVLFELGARWGAELPFVPLLGRGAMPKDLPGPVSGINALRADSGSQLHQLVHELSERLGRPLQNAAAYEKYLQRLILVSQASEESSSEPAHDMGEQQELETSVLAPPKTQSGKDLLEFIHSGDNPGARGLLEVFDTLSPGQITVFPNTIGSGTVAVIKPRLFREGVVELINKGWLYPPEDDGKTRTYEYKGPEIK